MATCLPCWTCCATARASLLNTPRTTPRLFSTVDLSYAAFVSDLLSDGTCDLMIHASDVPEDYKVSVSGGYSLVLTRGEGTVLTPPLETAIQGPMPSLAWCAEKVLSGEAGGILHPESELQLFLLNHGGCDNFAYAPAMRSTFSDVFEFAVGGPDAFSIAANLTRGLYHLKGELNYVELGEEYLLRGRLCPGGDNVEESETQVDLKHLSGLLILTYAALCIAILGGVGERVIRGTRLGKKKSDGEFQAENLGEISRPAELNENQVSRRTSKKCDENDTGKGEGTVVEGKAQMAVELKEVSISREIL